MAEKTKAMNRLTVDDLLHEDRIFEPSDSFKRNALIKDDKIYKEADKDPLQYWAKHAEKLDWFKKWDKVLEWNVPLDRKSVV